MAILSNCKLPPVLTQFVRFKSQRRCLGKPPGVARCFQDRLEELNYKDPSVHYKVNIGFARPHTKRREETSDRIQQIKKNRSELEHLARHNKLLVPLEEVQNTWDGVLTQSAAEHYGVYQHLFGDAYFSPVIRLNVTYPEGFPVFWGNFITPSQAKCQPKVSYEAKEDSYWTLALTTPDGHLSSDSREYVLWLVGNIAGSKIDSGVELVPYMQPFPVQGIGACRYVFVLYKQTRSLDFSSYLHSTSDWTKPASRDFSTYDFYSKMQTDLTPAGLVFFQAEWDDSVRSLFHNVFNSAEPVCSYDFPEHYHPKQKWFPLKKPFNLYMDKYRDEKQIAKEYLVRKLRDYDPWTGFKPPLAFPAAVRFKPNTPSWLKNEQRKQRLGKARMQDY